MVTSRWTLQAEHVAFVEEMRNEYKFFVEKSEGKRPLSFGRWTLCHGISSLNLSPVSGIFLIKTLFS
jgi:hypothetical protein